MNQPPPFLPDNLSESAGQPVPVSEAATRVVPVIEEHLTIGRELVETGRVRLTRRVHESEEQVRVLLQHDQVQVERIPLNQTLPAGAPAPGIRYEGDTMIVPVLREIAVVETRLLLVEELRVVTQRLPTEHTETVRLRREEIQVEHLPASTPPETPTT